MTSLATLVVKLEAETSQYQQQLAAATKQLQAFQSDVADFAEDLVKKFAAAFTIDKIAEFVAGAVESAAAMERLSQESGVAVEELSALQAVFAQSGVGQDEMASSLKKLNQAISDASGNAQSKAAFAFQALGISVTNANGSLKTAGQLLPEIADAYSKLADGPNKVAINIALLGRSANGLIPTLDKGAQGLEELQAAAIASGAALSGELAKAAEDLENKFIALKQSTTGTLSTAVLEASLPALNAFADGLAQIAKVASDSSGVFAAFTNVVLKPLGTVLLSLDVGLRDFGSGFGAVVNAAADAAHGKFSQAFHDLADGFDHVVDINTAGVHSVVNLWKSGGNSIADIADQTAKLVEQKSKEMFAGFNDQGTSLAFIQQLAEGQKKVADFAASLKVQAQSFNEGVAAQTALKLSTGELGDAVSLAQKTVNDLTAKGIDPYTDAAGKAAEATLKLAKSAQASSVQLQQQQDTKEITDYTDKLQEQVDKLNLGTVAATQYAETHGKLGKALSDSAVDGAKFKATIDDLTAQLVAAENAKGFANTSIQILDLQGNLVAAADAAYKLQLATNPNAANDPGYKAQLDTLHQLTDAQKAYQQVSNQIAADQAQTAVLVAGYDSDTIDGQQKIAAAYAAEALQVSGLYEQLQQIATSSGIPSLVTQSATAQAALENLKKQGVDPLAKTLKDDFENSASDSFAAFVTGTETASQAWHNFVNSLLSDLIKLQAKSFLESIFSDSGGGGGIFKGLAGILSGGGGGAAAAAGSTAGLGEDAFSTFEGLGFGGGLAGGGPVMPGNRYTVGEHGAEEFVPDTPGTIVPNSKMSKQQTVVNNFTINAPSGTISRPTQAQISAAAAGGVLRAQRRHM